MRELLSHNCSSPDTAVRLWCEVQH